MHDRFFKLPGFKVGICNNLDDPFLDMGMDKNYKILGKELGI